MLAYEFAEKKQVTIPKSWYDNRKTGRDWMWSFMKRHNLSLRSPEATTLGRATSFNRATVGVFFKNISDIWIDITFHQETFTSWMRPGVLLRKLHLK